MEILLLISALLTGITGVISGGRQAEVPQVELSASVQAAEAAVQLAEASVRQAPAFPILLVIAIIFFLAPLMRWYVTPQAMMRGRAPRSERCQE